MSRKRASLILTIIALLMLGLSGCGKDALDGTVTAKYVRPGYTYTYMQPIYTTSCSGSPSVCRSTMTGMVPIIYWVPTCYRIEVTAHATTEKGGKTCVDASKYEAVEIGDHYTGADVQPRDNKVKKGES